MLTPGNKWFSKRSALIWVIIIIIIAILIILVFLYRNPHYGLYPYNYVIDKCVDSQTFYHGDELREIFPESVQFESKWRDIRDEAQQVLHLSNENVWREFISAGEEFWKGWNVFTLRLYGVDVEENMDRCPILAKLLKRYPHIHTAVFSILEPGKVITPHYGPNKGVLRYHLGLVVPNSDQEPDETDGLNGESLGLSDPESYTLGLEATPPSQTDQLLNKCYLNVGDDTYYWREGEGVLFDETYLHSAHNDTDKLRVVLYMDIPRPMPYGWLNDMNDWVLWGIENSSHNRKAIRDRTK